MIYPKSCLVNPPTMSITGCLRSTHDFWFSHDMIKWHTILLANYYTILCNQESVIPNKKEAAIIKYQISNSQLNLKIGRSQISRNVTAMQLKILQRGLYSHYKKSILLTMCTSKSCHFIISSQTRQCQWFHIPFLRYSLRNKRNVWEQIIDAMNRLTSVTPMRSDQADKGHEEDLQGNNICADFCLYWKNTKSVVHQPPQPQERGILESERKLLAIIFINRSQQKPNLDKNPK